MSPLRSALAVLIAAGVLAACDTAVPGGASEADLLGTWRHTEDLSQQYVTTTADARALAFATPGSGGLTVEGAEAPPLLSYQSHQSRVEGSCAFGPECIESITLASGDDRAAVLTLRTTGERHRLSIVAGGTVERYVADPAAVEIDDRSVRLPRTPFRNELTPSDVVTVGGRVAFRFVDVPAGVETAVGGPRSFAPVEDPSVERWRVFEPGGVFRELRVQVTTGRVVASAEGTWALDGDRLRTEARDANGFVTTEIWRAEVDGDTLRLRAGFECADAACLPDQTGRLFLPSAIVTSVRYETTALHDRVPE